MKTPFPTVETIDAAADQRLCSQCVFCASGMDVVRCTNWHVNDAAGKAGHRVGAGLVTDFVSCISERRNRSFWLFRPRPCGEAGALWKPRGEK